MNRKIPILIALVAAQIGCATVKPITPEVAGALKGKRVAWTSTAKPGFSAMTAGKAMFGVLGAAAMISAGNDIVKKNGVEDPSAGMTQDLLAALGAKHGIVPGGAVAPGGDADDAYTLAQQFPDVELLLDVRTTGWSFAYFPTDWSHYRVTYSVKATLYDLKNKTVLVAGAAKRIPDQTPAAPTYDQLLDANAARLKAELKRLSDECLQDMRRDAFKL